MDMLTDEEVEEMKPYGEAFISEQLFVPQRMTSVPFPTEAYVGGVMSCDEFEKAYRPTARTVGTL